MDPASPLPTGTVTFLFTDIEGSTRLWEQQPEAMREDLANHDDLLRAAIESHSGHVFKTMGDACCLDGKTLAAGGGRSLILIDLTTRQEVAALKGHTGPIFGAAFSPDGNTLATASLDGTVRLWRAGPELRSLRSGEGRGPAGALAARGSRLAAKARSCRERKGPKVRRAAPVRARS